jgi:hypothetical protein
MFINGIILDFKTCARTDENFRRLTKYLSGTELMKFLCNFPKIHQLFNDFLTVYFIQFDTFSIRLLRWEHNISQHLLEKATCHYLWLLRERRHH